MEGHGDDGVDIEERYVEGEKERERERRERIEAIKLSLNPFLTHNRYRPLLFTFTSL